MGAVDSRMCGGGGGGGGEDNEAAASRMKANTLANEENNRRQQQQQKRQEQEQLRQQEVKAAAQAVPPSSATLTYLEMLRKMHQTDNTSSQNLYLPPKTTSSTTTSKTVPRLPLNQIPPTTAAATTAAATAATNASSNAVIDPIVNDTVRSLPAAPDTQSPRSDHESTSGSSTSGSGSSSDDDGGDNETPGAATTAATAATVTSKYSGTIEVYLVGVKGLPEQSGSLYVVCDIENAREKREIRSNTIPAVMEFPQWEETVGTLRVDDHMQQALRVNIFKKRKVRKDKLVYFVDVGLEQLSDNVLGEVVAELEQEGAPDELVGELHLQVRLTLDQKQ